jgi:ABC-type Zn uptake system ZnuABC Zn-binding protein ZnuA
LHLSGSSAAEHANSIDNDINLWWLSEEVQTARKNFAKEFANYSPEWKRTWQENFQSMIGN